MLRHGAGARSEPARSLLAWRCTDRRGANLPRFINNMPLDMRMALGGWRCLTVEAGYRACNARRRMQAVVGFQS